MFSSDDSRLGAEEVTAYRHLFGVHMIVAGHQPEFLPYSGFFSKIACADIFVIVDNVQYAKKSYQNRNRIRTQNGWQWLTVPVITKGRFHQPIREVRINNDVNWRHKHWRSILLNYGHAPHFEIHRSFFEEIYSERWDLLSDLNEALLLYLIRVLDIRVKVLKGSDLGISGSKTDLLVDICKKTGADCYLSGAGGRNYVDESKFKAHNLTHRFHDFHQPNYPQQFPDFVPNLSVVDLLFNVGEASREYLECSDQNR